MFRRIDQLWQRLPIAQHLSFQLLIGMVTAILFLVLFANIAEDIVEGDTIVQVDTALANELHTSATPGAIEFYRVMSFVGMEGVWVLSVAVGLLLVMRKVWRYLAVWGVALAGGLLLNLLVKSIFARPRPVFVDPIALEQSYSFPSGHAMVSFIAYGMLAYFLWRLLSNHRLLRIVVVWLAVMLVVLIGISRMVLGVHYLSDVLGGLSAGGVWLTACITANETIRRKAKPSQAVIPPLDPAASPGAGA